jgi:DNA-binding MarR family transcriptional regulator
MTKKKDAELEDNTLELWDTIMRLLKNFRIGRAAWEEVELTFPQAILLLELRKAGCCSMGDLSRRLHVTQGVATRMVDLLLEKGLVERHRDKSDRRIVNVEATAKGAAIAREIEKNNQRKIGDLLATVPEKERRYLLELLKRLETQLEEEIT